MRPWLIIVTSGPPKVLVVSHRTTKVLKSLESLDLQAVFAYKARATSIRVEVQTSGATTPCQTNGSNY